MFTLSTLLGVKTSKVIDHTRIQPCTGTGCGTCQHLSDVILELSTTKDGEVLSNDAQSSLAAVQNVLNIHSELRKRVVSSRRRHWQHDLWPLSYFTETRETLSGGIKEETDKHKYYKFQFPDNSGHAFLTHDPDTGLYRGYIVTLIGNGRSIYPTDSSPLSTEAVFNLQKTYFDHHDLEHPWFHND